MNRIPRLAGLFRRLFINSPSRSIEASFLQSISIAPHPRFYRSATKNMSRGAFIVLEGCDRCGKSTQSALLVDNLNSRGYPAKLVSFPDRTTRVGALVSNYLKNEENLEDHVIHLLFTANRWEMKNTLFELLNKGITVVADRYCYSGVAYSAAKKGMDFDWCRGPESGLPAPDEVDFLELHPEVAATRGQFGEERYENPTTQALVRKVYRRLSDPTWKFVDAGKSREDLQQELLELAESTIARSKDKSIKLLWSELFTKKECD